jgi:hypothetical protein
MKNILRYKWLFLCLLVHICFFLSAAYFHWFDIFFNANALHVGAKGIDFYQIPSGAWSAWHGGSLTGAPIHGSVYAPGEWVNSNVYHPLFTLALGSLLMQFPPATAYYVWLWAKLPLSLAGVAYFYWSFRDHKYVQFASCILLINASIYLELAAGQFHEVFNVLVLVLLTTLIKRKPVFVSGMLYWLCLLVKPIGLLFIPVLLMKGRWKVAVIGIVLFSLVTWLFAKDPYYINNLTNNILHPWYTPDGQIVTLNALIRYNTHWPDLAYTIIQDSFLVLILTLASFSRIEISKAIFLLIVYFLCFYTLLYEYHWSTLAYVCAVCLVTCPSFQTKLSRISVLLICLPSCFVVLNLFHIDVTHNIPGMFAWQFIVLSKLDPLFLLTGSVLWADIKPIATQGKAFIVAMRKVNEHLDVFGEE